MHLPTWDLKLVTQYWSKNNQLDPYTKHRAEDGSSQCAVINLVSPLCHDESYFLDFWLIFLLDFEFDRLHLVSISLKALYIDNSNQQFKDDAMDSLF